MLSQTRCNKSCEGRTSRLRNIPSPPSGDCSGDGVWDHTFPVFSWCFEPAIFRYDLRFGGITPVVGCHDLHSVLIEDVLNIAVQQSQRGDSLFGEFYVDI